MKTINAAKLEAGGIAKVRAACLIHAEKAIVYKDKPDKKRLFELHCDLLDQCGVIGRKLLQNTTNKTTARENLALV